jgi:hypothetical protein
MYRRFGLEESNSFLVATAVLPHIYLNDFWCSKHSIGISPMLIPASPDCGAPEPDSVASTALESFAGIPCVDDVPTLISGG